MKSLALAVAGLALSGSALLVAGPALASDAGRALVPPTSHCVKKGTEWVC